MATEAVEVMVVAEDLEEEAVSVGELEAVAQVAEVMAEVVATEAAVEV